MAPQFVLGKAEKGKTICIGHDHCEECGSCLFDKDARHRCIGEFDVSILEVFLMDMTPKGSHPTIAKVPEGFNEV